VVLDEMVILKLKAAEFARVIY